MKNIFCAFILVFTVSHSASALDVGLEFGVRSQSADVDTPATSKSQMGMQFGATTIVPIVNNLNLRTGMLYTQRPITKEVSGSEYKYTLNYVDIPVQLLLKLEEYAGIYFGVAVAMNMDKNCSGVAGCTVTGVKTPLIPLTFGATFKFAPQLGGSLQFETASGDAADGLKNFRAVGANLIVFFE